MVKTFNRIDGRSSPQRGSLWHGVKKVGYPRIVRGYGDPELEYDRDALRPMKK